MRRSRLLLFLLTALVLADASPISLCQPAAITDDQTGTELYRSGDCTTAFGHLQQSTGRALLLAGNCYLLMRDYAKAQNALEKFRASAPQDERAVALLSSAYCHEGKYQNAISLIKTLIDKSPDDPLLLNALAAAYTEAGQPQPASQIWQRVLSADPEDPQALSGLGTLALADGSPRTASDFFNRAIAVAPDHAAARAGLGRIALQHGDFVEAANSLQRAYAANPASREVGKDLALAYLKLNKWDAVLSTIEGISFGLGEDDEFATVYSQAAQHVNDSPRAEKYYRDTLNKVPKGAVAALLLGDLLWDAGKLDDAKKVYAQGIAASNSVPQLGNDIRGHLGLAQFRTNDLNGARATLERVLAKDHDDPKAMFLLAQIADKQARWDDASSYANQLLLKDPNNIALIHVLADAALSQNLDAEAARYLEQLILLDPKDKAIRLKLVVLYSNHKNLGQVSRAFDLLNDIIGTSPDDPEPLLLLANLYRKNDQPDKAQEFFMKGFQKLPSDASASYSWAYNSFGLLLFQEKNYNDALYYQQKAVQLNPADDEANFNLALTDLKIGNRDELLKVLQHLRDLQSSLATNLEQVMDRAGIKYPKTEIQN